MLEVKNLVKVYKTKGGVETKALDDVSVNFPETGLVFLLGKSGSGKSTLLNMIGGLDRPDSGEIVVKGRSSKDFSQADFDSYRNTYIGFIFQEYNVLNEFNIEQNISLALQLQGKKNDKEAVNALLKEVDLEGFNKRKPNTLSGGQKQRIAIARALIKQPEIIMADEPTGALDSNTGKQVLETLKKLSKTKLVIIVSHDQDFAQEYGDRIIELKDGKILSDKSKEYVAPKAINEKMQIINGNIIDIKKGSDLTEADFKQLYQMIKKQDKEVLISTGEDNIKVAKKAARISDDGKGERFSDTKEVKVKEYDGKETKFIRSHMPFSRSFKMGASGLKTKPFRLILTILLSTVSFAMFGVVSTLMFYDPAYSLAKAMEHMDRKSESVVKSYKYQGQYVTIDNATGEIYETQGDKKENTSLTYYGVDELNQLNAQNGNKFIGVFDLQEHYSSYSVNNQAFQFQGVEVDPSSNDDSDYYSVNYFTGLSDNAEEILRVNGYNLTGEYPKKENEIAISNYHFDLIKKSQAFGNLNSPTDVLGKSLKVTYRGPNYNSKNATFKITGVYDFGALSNAYDSLKQAKPASQSDRNRESERDNFYAYLCGSLYSTGYVAPAFYEKNGFIPVSRDQAQVNNLYARGVISARSREEAEGWDVNPDTGMSFIPVDELNNDNTDFYDLDFKKASNPITLSSHEVLLSYSSYYQNYQRSIYLNPLDSYHDLIMHYNEYDDEAVAINNDWYNMQSENEIVQAYYRVRNSFDNKDSGESYPEGYTLEGDCKLIKDKAIEIFNRNTPKAYVQKVVTKLNDYFEDGHYMEKPVNWDTYQDYCYRLTNSENRTTDTEFTELSRYLKEDVIPTIPSATTNDALVKTTMYALFMQSISGDVNKKVTDAMAEAYGSDDYSKDMDHWQFSDYAIDDDLSLVFDNLFLAGYKAAYGSEATLSYAYNPSFLTYIEDTKAPRIDVPSKLYTKDNGGTIVEYTVKGFADIDGMDYFEMVGVRSDFSKYLKDSYSWKEVKETSYVAPEDAKYVAAIAMTDYSQADIALFTKDNGTYLYNMTNPVYQQASFYTNMIKELSTIFLIVGAITGVLAALMLLNFISVSISSKNKDIGILRAVGARGSDVFKIFFSESSVIAAICFTLAAVGAGITCYYLNQTFIDSVLGVALLNYGVVNILLILGVSIVISFIATFIPVVIASKKPPVEAIRAL